MEVNLCCSTQTIRGPTGRSSDGMFTKQLKKKGCSALLYGCAILWGVFCLLPFIHSIPFPFLLLLHLWLLNDIPLCGSLCESVLALFP